MIIRNYTNADLPALLDFVAAHSSWGADGQELGRATFAQGLGQPGLAPERNGFLLDDGGALRGFALLSLELPIGRSVIELVAGDVGLDEVMGLVSHTVQRARESGAAVAHICLPASSPLRGRLPDLGFHPVQTYLDMLWRGDTLAAAALPDGYSVRPFQEGDAARLAAIQNAAFAASWGFCPNTPEQIAYRSRMANTSAAGILFLQDGAETAGYCWTTLLPVNGARRGRIGMIGIAPAYRGRGVSRPILYAGMAYLRTLGVDGIGLEVDGSNAPAVGLYTSTGFQITGELHWFERPLA